MTTEQKLEMALREIKRAMNCIDRETAWYEVPDNSTQMKVWRRLDNLLDILEQ